MGIFTEKKTQKQKNVKKKTKKQKQKQKHEKHLCIWATRDGESKVVNTHAAQRTASQDAKARGGEEE